MDLSKLLSDVRHFVLGNDGKLVEVSAWPNRHEVLYRGSDLYAALQSADVRSAPLVIPQRELSAVEAKALQQAMAEELAAAPTVSAGGRSAPPLDLNEVERELRMLRLWLNDF